MDRVSRRRLRRLEADLEDRALRQEVERLSAEPGLDAHEVLEALAGARRILAWCRAWRLLHGARWVDGKLDWEPEVRAYATAHGCDPDEAVADVRGRLKTSGR
jgi:hypothetical protein